MPHKVLRLALCHFQMGKLSLRLEIWYSEFVIIVRSSRDQTLKRSQRKNRIPILRSLNQPKTTQTQWLQAVMTNRHNNNSQMLLGSHRPKSIPYWSLWWRWFAFCSSLSRFSLAPSSSNALNQTEPKTLHRQTVISTEYKTLRLLLSQRK